MELGKLNTSLSCASCGTPLEDVDDYLIIGDAVYCSGCAERNYGIID